MSVDEIYEPVECDKCGETVEYESTLRCPNCERTFCSICVPQHDDDLCPECEASAQ